MPSLPLRGRGAAARPGSYNVCCAWHDERFGCLGRAQMENNTRLERDLDEMRVYIERMKNDVITYSIGSILSCMTAVAALLRIFM